jgi:hypothetical protein
MLSSSVVKQIGLAFLIASPIAWYVMLEWLKSFEYRISLQVWVFLLAGVVALLIALVTISYRTLRAVGVNPADTLRQE